MRYVLLFILTALNTAFCSDAFTPEEVKALTQTPAGKKALERIFELSDARKQNDEIRALCFARIISLNLDMALTKREGANEVVTKDERRILTAYLSDPEPWRRAGLLSISGDELVSMSEYFAKLPEKYKMRPEIFDDATTAALILRVIKGIGANPDVKIATIVAHVKKHLDDATLKTMDGWKELRR